MLSTGAAFWSLITYVNDRVSQGLVPNETQVSGDLEKSYIAYSFWREQCRTGTRHADGVEFIALILATPPSSRQNGNCTPELD